MASFSFGTDHPYPAGTVVYAWQDFGYTPNPNAPPPGTYVTAATVDAGQELTITGLAEGTNYWVAGLVAGIWRWVRAQIDATTTVIGEFEPTYIQAGNLGAAYTLDLFEVSGGIILLEGTLDANCTITITNRRQCLITVLATQDATGGRTLTISDGSETEAVDIPTEPLAPTSVELILPDATKVYVNHVGGTAGRDGTDGADGADGIDGSSDVPNIWTPPVNGLLAATSDLRVNGAVPLSIGYITTGRIPLNAPITVTNLVICIQTGDAGLTTAVGFLYKLDGALIARTGSQTATWDSTGPKVMALTPEAGQSLTLPTADVIFGLWCLGGQPNAKGTVSVDADLTNIGQSSPALNSGKVATETVLDPLAGVANNDTGQVWGALS